MPASVSGYYGQPIVKPPVWTWQIGLYLFVGGTAGMSGVIALASLLTGQSARSRARRSRRGVRGRADLAGPADLGSRPAGAFPQHAPRLQVALRDVDGRVDALRVQRLRGIGVRAGRSLGLPDAIGIPPAALRGIALALVAGTALSGAVLATYTGVLLGATAVPVWSAHHKLLPFHFGIVGLASAACGPRAARVPPRRAERDRPGRCRGRRPVSGSGSRSLVRVRRRVRSTTARPACFCGSPRF